MNEEEDGNKKRERKKKKKRKKGGARSWTCRGRHGHHGSKSSSMVGTDEVNRP